MKSKITIKVFSAVMALSILFGTLGFTLNVAASSMENTQSAAEKETFNYVALGASSVAGYGLHGYNYDFVYEYPKDKAVNNRYGYKMYPEGSYPVLLKEALDETYNTNLDVIAFSSMRAEELHVLLDNDYYGDSYTDFWLFDTYGNGGGSMWGYNPGAYEYERFAEAGVPGYVVGHTPTADEAFVALRRAAQEAVAAADLVTIDSGMNNFGTYMLNLVAGGIFTNDIAKIDPQLDRYYEIAKEYILMMLTNVLGASALPAATLSNFADTLSYALVGYCLNTDAIVEHILELNPDAEIVLISAQSMLHDMDVVIPGIDGVVPFGDIFDEIVNLANLYGAVLSPYADRYYFASISENGHVEYLKDEIAAYNGDPSTIGRHMKECFDVLDSGIFLQTRVWQMTALQMCEAGMLTMTDAQKDTSNVTAFYNGYHYDRYGDAENPPIKLNDGTYFKDFIKNGEAGLLEGELLAMYECYEETLELAYDVTMEILQATANASTVDLVIATNPAYSGVKIAPIIVEVINKAAANLMADPDYSFDLDELYPAGFFETYDSEYGFPAGTVCSKLTYALFLELAESALSHPNYGGHVELFEGALDAYTNKITGKDVINGQIGVDYTPKADSLYVAISTANTDYADIFAEKIGLGANQVGHLTWNDLDYDMINKADLVSIGFSEDEAFGMSLDQILGFVANYMDTDLRAALYNYIVGLVKKLPFHMSNKDIAMIVDMAVDGILGMELLRDAEVVELDWDSVVGIEDRLIVDFAAAGLKNSVINVLGSDSYTFELDIAELIGGFSGLSTDFLYRYLGDSAIFSIDIPLADGIALAMETYVYKFVEYTVRSTSLINHINSVNPDAAVVILGHFNPIRNSYLEIGGMSVNVGDLFEVIDLGATIRSLLQFAQSDNSTFIYIMNAQSNYVAEVNSGIIDNDFLTFLVSYIMDRDILDIAPESYGYVAEQMLSYVNIKCDHQYDSECDAVCNKCDETRVVPHLYDGCEDTDCNLCGAVRDAAEHITTGCVDTECDACGSTVAAKGHTYGDWTVTKAATADAEGEESRVCSECSDVEVRSIPKITAGGNDPVQEPKNNSSAALIVIIVIVVLGGAGFAAYWFLIRKKGATAKADETADDSKEEETSETEESGEN